jgi:hypothetical protein
MILFERTFRASLAARVAAILVFAKAVTASAITKLRKGWELTTRYVERPMKGKPETVIAAKLVLSRQDGPTILFGLSFGMMIVTQASTDASMSPKTIELTASHTSTTRHANEQSDLVVDGSTNRE